MTPALLAAVALGGMVGAPARYLLDRAVSRRAGGAMPWGTWVVNVTGSLLLGLLTGLAQHGHLSPVAQAVTATGFCGAFTTFSTFTVEAVRLVQDDALGTAARYLGTSVLVGLAAAGVGIALGLAA